MAKNLAYCCDDFRKIFAFLIAFQNKKGILQM